MTDPWTKEDARQWNAALNATGEALIRVRFRSGATLVDDAKVEPPREFTMQWLAGRAARHARVRFLLVLVYVVAVSVAIAAVVAAWPIIFTPKP